MTSSTSSQSSSMFPCQLQMRQKPIKLHRLLSRKVGWFCSSTVILVVCFGLKSKTCATHVQHLSCGSCLQVCWIRHWSSWRKQSTCMEECVMISSLRPVTATACWPKRPSCKGRQLRYSCNNSQQHEHVSVQFHFGMQITYDLVIYILNIKMGIHDWYIDNTGSIFL